MKINKTDYERRVSIDFRYYKAFNRTSDIVDVDEGLYVLKTQGQ